jgi:Flp pilus assembly protein TadG
MRTFRTHRTRTDERGQTAVEFALVLPILAVLLIAIIEFGVVFHDYVTVTDASRVAARKAAVSRLGGAPYDQAAETAGKNSAPGLDWSKTGAGVDCTSPDWTKAGGDVSCTVTYPFSVNLVGWVVKSGTLTSKTTERLE